MSHDRRCAELARAFLADYRLSREERQEETKRLAQAIQSVIETELEALEHRRRA